MTVEAVRRVDASAAVVTRPSDALVAAIPESVINTLAAGGTRTAGAGVDFRLAQQATEVR